MDFTFRHYMFFKDKQKTQYFQQDFVASPSLTGNQPHLDLTALLKQQGVLAALGKHPRNLPVSDFCCLQKFQTPRGWVVQPQFKSKILQLKKKKINSEFNSPWVDHNSGNQLPFFLICTPKPELCTSGWSATAEISLATSRWPWRSTKRCSASCLFSCSWWWFKVSTEQKPVTFHEILVV